MTLNELRERLEAKRLVRGETTPLDGTALGHELSGVAYDSRQVTTGAVFVALKGLRTDGVRFADQALARGARVVVSESLPPEGLGGAVAGRLGRSSGSGGCRDDLLRAGRAMTSLWRA